MATTILKWLSGTLTTVLNTGATLASNALALSSEITWSETDYLAAEIEFAGTFGSAPAAGFGLSVWFLRAPDGTNYEDGSASVTPARAPDVVLPFRSTTAAQRVVRRCTLPPGTCKVLAKNDGSGQTLNAGWTVKARPLTQQGASA